MNSHKKGEQFEKEFTQLFKSNNVELRQTKKEPGDGGIDQFGGYRGYTILGQCKNYPEPGSIGPQYVRDLEGVLSRYHKNTTIGLLVAPSKASFSKNTINRANSSEYIIILTDITNAYSDLVRFVGSQPPVVFQQTRSSIHCIFHFYFIIIITLLLCVLFQTKFIDASAGTRKIFEKVIEIF
ncbi:hypothetical protein C2G38_166079 [Gigaspora rosea]|uniref:Restriction endonuclease type IV Mrr domain-containing protein n=1 Tax=Gigaspora rosea TaxID=44941 RepID=A0A397UKB8_9GLOM|nr:hypothetical protein C2G38_166079 [Gigaspora rosea]